MYETIIEDFDLTVGQFFGPNEKRMAKLVDNINHLEKRLDDVLDRPFNEEDGHVACGDILENVRGALNDLIGEMGYYKRMFMAKARAWDRYEKGSELDEEYKSGCRMGYIAGYMDATK